MQLDVGRQITLSEEPHPSYAKKGAGALIGGVAADNERFGDGKWVAWSGSDMEAVIDFGEELCQ